MSTSIDRVQAELEGLGYRTTVFDTPRMPVVSFDYVIEAGSHKGTQVRLRDRGGIAQGHAGHGVPSTHSLIDSLAPLPRRFLPRISAALGVRNTAG